MKLFGFFAVSSAFANQELYEMFDNSQIAESARTGTNNVNQFTMFYAQMANMPNFLDFAAQEWNYGCWGQIDGVEARPGHGEAIDVIDQLFQDWVKCKECMSMDFTDSCDIDNVAYEVGMDPATGRIECSGNSGCPKARCDCDETLAFGIIENWDSYNPENEPQNGFDFDASCQPHPKTPTSGGAGGSCTNVGDNTRRCCGEYPKRFPYDDKAGCFLCCDSAGKIFNINRHGCCGDVLGTVGCV
ncbi:Oidioi.mRNA.OKI2018_I69.chr2.g5685.t1.cds [Oikopleura dioica]|uniref:Oidioi.mRNA.OKI2018_I69.chr2.g5685.t1.cds n=1 Tax=Oikopleura dioica TaxID=34765 RepID=A0ABN7T5G4_OIKDI|nr:Oidioi.mRNA.OKI2018_I69.chr2.g5685.t1.cds [Oikopleura dioica]